MMRYVMVVGCLMHAGCVCTINSLLICLPAQVVVEYVSAPRAYEDLLGAGEHADEEDERPGLGGYRAGLGASNDQEEAQKVIVLGLWCG